MITALYKVYIGFCPVDFENQNHLHNALASASESLLDSENNAGPTIVMGDPSCDTYIFGYATSLANAIKAEDLICRILQNHNALIYRY